MQREQALAKCRGWIGKPASIGCGIESGQSSAAKVAHGYSAHWTELDGLRGLLALGVVVYHFGLNDFFGQMGWKGIAFKLAVDVFFLLSGFVLAHSVHTEIDPVRFGVRRFLRLAPVFYLTTLAVLLIHPEQFSPLELIMASDLTGVWPANFPAWSIVWEFYLPIVAAFSPWRVPKSAVVPLLIVCLIASRSPVCLRFKAASFTSSGPYSALAGAICCTAPDSTPGCLSYPCCAS
jgi:peptidoglycan/LPS O-acetylase OafA/YrhL